MYYLIKECEPSIAMWMQIATACSIYQAFFTVRSTSLLPLHFMCDVNRGSLEILEAVLTLNSTLQENGIKTRTS